VIQPFAVAYCTGATLICAWVWNTFAGYVRQAGGDLRPS
jgi:hypothetical protein